MRNFLQLLAYGSFFVLCAFIGGGLLPQQGPLDPFQKALITVSVLIHVLIQAIRLYFAALDVQVLQQALKDEKEKLAELMKLYHKELNAGRSKAAELASEQMDRFIENSTQSSYIEQLIALSNKHNLKPLPHDTNTR